MIDRAADRSRRVNEGPRAGAPVAALASATVTPSERVADPGNRSRQPIPATWAQNGEGSPLSQGAEAAESYAVGRFDTDEGECIVN